jgi:hypothetical protein
MLPWQYSLFVEKSDGYPTMQIYQICIVSKTLYNIAVAILILISLRQDIFTDITFILSLLISLYGFSNLVIQLKIDDISKYDMILVAKDKKISDKDNNDSIVINDVEMPDNPIILAAIIDADVMIEMAKPSIVTIEDDANYNEQYRKSETFLCDNEHFFTSATKYADKQNELLRMQLKALNITPLEYMPLDELKKQIEKLVEKLNSNHVISEDENKRLDYLLVCLGSNPEYIAEQEKELQLWYEKSRVFIEESAITMRNIIPPDIFHCSITNLKEKYDMNASLAKRLFDKKCLWLIRMSPDYISKPHEVDLLNKYSYQAQNLDVMELSAIYGCLPNTFLNDGFDRKKKYKSDLLIEIRKMLSLYNDNKLPSNKIRNPVYKNCKQLFIHDYSLYPDNLLHTDDIKSEQSANDESNSVVVEIKSDQQQANVVVDEALRSTNSHRVRKLSLFLGEFLNNKQSSDKK